MKWLHELYRETLRWSESRYATWALVGVAFFGSTVFPLPTEAVMIPMILAAPRRAFRLSTIALLASVLGGISGYLLGWAAYDTLGSAIIERLGMEETFARFTGLYEEYGWQIVFMGGLTPFPYKVISIASGVVKMNLAAFVLASAISRAARYYFIAFLLYKYGEKAREWIDRNLEWLSTLCFILILAGFWLVKMV